MKILIVEDTDDSRVLLEDSLRLNNYEVVSAVNGIEALQILHSTDIDLIISDILMPQMDGYELCRIIKRDIKLSAIPFIFYTATYTQHEDEKLALALGADRFIVKPQIPSKIIESIEELAAENKITKKKTVLSSGDSEALEVLHVEVLNRKLNEKIVELEAQQKRLELLTDALPALISEVGPDGCYRYVNKAYEVWHGVKRENITGRHVRDLVGEPAYQIIQPHLEKALNGEEVTYEHQITFKNGETKYIKAIYVPILNEEAEVNGCYALVSDITEQKENELQLRRVSKMDALGKLTGGIAHDFNNMLAVISGYAEILASDLKDNERLHEFVGQIQKASTRGADLTEKLLGFSRQKQLGPETIDLNQQILDMQSMLERTLTVNIDLRTELRADIKQVYLDKGDLEDAVVNICINAMHAMTNGGHLIISTENVTLDSEEVAINNLTQDEFVMLSFDDDGSGISEEVITKVFDPFFTTKGASGTGLGLSQVYGFIQRTGGIVKISSGADSGTTVSLFIPAYSGDGEKTIKEKKSADGVAKGDEKILVVDDEKAIRDLVEEILKNNGYKVKVAASVLAAFSQLETEVPDLVITDVIMPGMNGYELTDHIVKNYPQTKVQIISGFADVEGESNADPVLSKNILYKPFTATELLATVRQQLDG